MREPVRAVLFDLLTALLDSWTVWNTAAGSTSAGRAWRAEYLRLTYGCGAYQPYERLVLEAALATGLGEREVDALERLWATLPPWSGAAEALARLQGRYRLGVVTNCSVRLGRLAATRLAVAWDVVVTAEEAGAYKPDVRPYRMAMDALGTTSADTRFVCGSGYDLFGTSALGLRTYWHNRAGLARPAGAPAPELESPTLDALCDWIDGPAVPPAP